MKLYKVITTICTILVLIFSFGINAYSHSGRTDSSGGHRDTKTGTYHYHNGGTSNSSNYWYDADAANFSRQASAELYKYSREFKNLNNKEEIKVFINDGQIKFDIPPIIVNNRIMVPLRGIFEALGANVIWDPINEYILATKNNIKIKLYVDGNVTVNNNAYCSDTPLIIQNDTTSDRNSLTAIQ